MQSEDLRIYIDSINRFPILSREEEYQLATFYYHTQSDKAKEKLINSNLRFVVKMAHRYSGYVTPTFSLLDLVQEGNRGLIRAVEMFDPYKGFKLVTYCAFWIRAKMNEAILHRHGITTGHKTLERKTFFKTAKIKNILMEERESKREELLADLQQEIDITHDDLEVLRTQIYLTRISTSSTLKKTDETFFEEIMKAKEDTEQEIEDNETLKIKKIYMYQAMELLSEEEQQVIRMKYMNGEKITSSVQVSKAMGMGRERIRQLESSAIAKMKKEVGLTCPV